MTTLSVPLPDDLLRAARQKLAGHAGDLSVEEFVLHALHGLVDDGVPLDPSTESLVLQGLQTPLLNAGQVDWDAKRKIVDSIEAGVR